MDERAADAIIQDLRRLSKAEVQSSIRESASLDTDIELESQVIGLRCPIVQTRIKIPVRSSTCLHLQCFDAENWFSFTKGNTTQSCPVCNDSVDTSDLVVDMYYEEILKEVPSNVDEVIIHGDGEWSTQDGNYKSPGCVAQKFKDSHSTGQRTRPASSARPRTVIDVDSQENEVVEIRPPITDIAKLLRKLRLEE